MRTPLRCILSLWLIAGAAVTLVAGGLAGLRVYEARERVAVHVSAFHSYSATQPESSSAEVVTGFLTQRPPASDELLVGTIDEQMVHLPIARPHASTTAALELLIDEKTAARQLTHQSIAVVDRRGGQAELIVGVDRHPARTRDLVVVGVVAASLLTVALLGTWLMRVDKRRNVTTPGPRGSQALATLVRQA